MMVRVKRHRFDPWSGMMVAIVTLVCAIIIGLLIIVFGLSFFDGLPGDPDINYSLTNYKRIFLDSFTYKVFVNTVAFSIISLVVAFFFGIPIAWLVERTDFPGKTLLFTLMTIGLLIPGFMVAMGWVFLLHPRIGIFNQWLMKLLDLHYSLLNIATIPGMGFVQGLNLAPLAFIMTASVFRSMDPALEEAAQVSGANLRRTVRLVTVPLIWPGILAAGIYIFTLGFAVFDVPAIIGWSNRIYTFSTYIYLEVSPQDDLPHYGGAAALSMFVVGLAALLSWWYGSVQGKARRYEVVTGRAYRPKLIKLGRNVILAWVLVAAYVLLSKALPLIMLLWASAFPYYMLPSLEALSHATLVNYRSIPWDLVVRGAKDTGILMLLTPTITVPMSLVFSWVVLRSRLPGRFVFDFVVFLPHAIPNIIFGVAALLLALFVLQSLVPMYGTVWLLLFIFVIVRLSYATRMTNSALIQVHQELEEAARVSGAGNWSVLRQILLPILTPTMLYSWLWIALLTYRELTLAIILSTPDNITLPVVVWSIWLQGGLGQASAVTIIMLAFLAPIIAIFWLVVRRTGIIPQEV